MRARMLAGADDAGNADGGGQHAPVEVPNEPQAGGVGSETMEARQRHSLLGLALVEARTSLLGALGKPAFDAL